MTGCAYVEYKRVYDIRPVLSISQRLIVSELIENYFLDQGFILKQKYHDHYPDDKYVTVLEVPRSPKDNERREFILSISVNSTGQVKLSHSEYFLQNIREIPADVLAKASTEIIQKVKAVTGIKIELSLSQKSYD
jgi:hypothetical protein